MSIEAHWYKCFSSDGSPPHRRRLSRQPMARQWQAAIDLAVGLASGTVGYRPVGRNGYGEVTWYWPQPEGDWWLVPYRVEQRAFALVRAATACELHRGRGRADGAAIVRRLATWRRTGQWRPVAAALYPRHGRGREGKKIPEKPDLIRADV